MKTYEEALEYARRLGADVDILCDTGSGNENPYHGPYHVIYAGHLGHYRDVNGWKVCATIRMVAHIEEFIHLPARHKELA